MTTVAEKTIKINCKGCWRICALGFSTRVLEEEVFDKQGNYLGMATKYLQASGHEVCPDCGREYFFPDDDEDPRAIPVITTNVVTMIYTGPRETPWEEKCIENFLFKRDGRC